ncbi:alanine/glycine:cation symporter family protein [Marinobacterium mangrovicola]|uniref:AGCS family alanine or glycine:cation symporter n=1 Tax=Marinobacterium mangrovicola TaxID=1476959 RepID=A0A4R1H412_9GAMM|nr:amino acid carrier protein [Marinobacterium mangrovicola]TCK16404.1 AGCS family alanine or glycine:cation symporter [Marinobacterium mangrovicola]
MRAKILLACRWLLPAFAITLFAPPAWANGAINDLHQQAQSLIYGFMGLVFTSVPLGGTQVPIIILWLIAGALFCTVYFKFLQFRSLRLSYRLIKGEFNDPDAPGEVTHFQSLSSALSVTVGLGNISGVAIAIAVGGPGAVFWMVLMGFFGMATKFAECTLGVKYRDIHADGSVSGGPMHYIRKGFAEKGMPRLGIILATFIALAITLATFVSTNMYQVNQAYTQVAVVVGENSFLAQNSWIFGIGFALVVGTIVIGGIKSIASVADKLVPFMAVFYVGTSLIVLAYHIDEIPHAFVVIFEAAFNLDSAAGGFWGAVTQGIIRSLISNEAGMGTASIAHATAKTRFPAAEGYVALLEPFIDTVIICTMTALVIVVTGTYTNTELSGVALTSAAYASVFPWFPYALAISICLFAFSTVLVVAYYGMTASSMLFGDRKLVRHLYLAIFLCLTVAGSMLKLELIVNLMDTLVVLICIPNLIGVYMLASIVRDERRKFLKYVKQHDAQRATSQESSPPPLHTSQDT